MLNLLNNFSIEQIIIFVVILALAIKELSTLFDFFVKRLENRFNGKKNEQEDKEEIKNDIEELKYLINEIKDNQKKTQDIIDVLLRSDVEDTRSWIVRNYHYYMDHPELPISDFEMDCIEKRFLCYQEEGGNSYVHDLVDELRKMHKERNKR